MARMPKMTRGERRSTKIPFERGSDFGGVLRYSGGRLHSEVASAFTTVTEGASVSQAARLLFLHVIQKGAAVSVEIAPSITVQRPQRADARRNFDALLAAGRAAFAENGSDASLEDVARRAGVGIGTLYRNFPTRESFLEALYIEEIAALVRVSDESTALEPGEAFRAWIDRFLEYAKNKKALIEGLNKESDTLKQCRVVMYAAGEPVLKRAQAARAIRADADIQDVLFMVSGIAGVAFTDDAQRARVLQLALDGLKP